MNKIMELYKKWTDGEDDNPFASDESWNGDMVEGFVAFCLKETSQNTGGKS